MGKISQGPTPKKKKFYSQLVAAETGEISFLKELTP